MFLPHFKPLTTNDYVDLFRSVRFCQLFPIQNRTKFRVLQSMNGYQTNGGRKRVRFVRLCYPIDFVGLAALICVQCAIERLVDHCIIKRDNNLSTGMKQNACGKKIEMSTVDMDMNYTFVFFSFSQTNSLESLGCDEWHRMNRWLYISQTRVSEYQIALYSFCVYIR